MRTTKILVLVLASVLLAESAAWGQVISGDLVGTVSDATGAAVPAAAIEALNTATGVKSAGRANDSGQYRISNLPSGTYKITASAPGFSQASVGGVVIDVSKIATVNLTVQVGQLATTVEVTSAPVVIDTTTATIQNTFDTRAARDLPVSSIGIGPVNLSLLSAGVTGNNNIGSGEGPSVGGQRPYNNNFMIEGVDNNNKSVTGSLLRIFPNDAVGEFTILQNQMSAEFGHSSGGQFNTTIKSGTNQIHGTLYEYLQNKTLNAIDQQVANQAYANGEKPVNSRIDSNRFGGSIGGPILKNKLFYFFDLEYNPFGAAGTTPAVETPTAAGFAALSAIPGLNQTNLDILKKYVPASSNVVDSTTVRGVTIPLGTAQISKPNYQNNTAGVASMDYNLSDKDQLRGRYIYNRLAAIDATADLPVFFQATLATYHLASIAEYHNFSPNLMNEFRLGYNRLNQTIPAGNYQYPGLDQFPSLIFNDLALTLGPNPSAPQFAVQNTYQLANNLTWAKGAHTFKFGVEGRKYIAPQSFTQRSRGQYGYSSLDIYLRDLTPDSEAQRGLGNVTYYGDQIAFYSFVNDTWRVRPNFTVNLGLRHEYTTIPYSERLQTLNAISNVPGLITFGEPKAQTKNFAPRVGIAYSPGSDGKTSIRAGFGMAYDVLYDNIGVLNLPPQLKTTVDVTNNADPLAGAPNFLKNGGILPSLGSTLTAAAARTNTAAFVGDQKLPYSIQWNIGIQRVFAKDYTFEARYLGTRGVHLDIQDRINVQAVVSATNNIPTFITAPSAAQLSGLTTTLADVRANGKGLLPAFANAGFTTNIIENRPIGNSTYHGLALQLNRRFSSGLQFQGAYTWSHLIDDSTADFNTTALTPRRPQDFQNIRIERSSSALDRRHRLTFAALYDVQWFRNSNWFLKNLVGNWTAAPIYTFESPEYVTVQSNIDANLNGDRATDRVIINPAGTSGIGSDVTPLCLGGAACGKSPADKMIVGYVAVNPNARYIRAQRGTIANGGRNTLSGRRVNNVDLSLIKNFNVTERMKVQFTAQFFNAFNHAQFVPGLVDRVDVLSSVYNNGPGVVNYLTPGNASFNNPESIYSNNPRAIQLAVKFIF